MEMPETAKSFKGEGQVAILGLLKNDDDTSMKHMTDELEKRLKQSNRSYTRSDCLASLEECNIWGASKVYLTGHSRFMDGSSHIRTMSERSLGGFPIDEVVEVLFSQGIRQYQLTEIELWCCETACKAGTEKLSGGSTGSEEQNFGFPALDQLNTCFRTGNWVNVSTLDYICGKLFERAMKETLGGIAFNLMYIQPIYITALNGVGYFDKSTPYITTFEQKSMLKTANEIIYTEIGQKGGFTGTYKEKNLSEAKERLTKHIAARPCHYITSVLNFGAIVVDAGKQESFLDAKMKIFPNTDYQFGLEFLREKNNSETEGKAEGKSKDKQPNPGKKDNKSNKK